MNRRSWIRCTPSAPCRHCGRDDERCATAPDGRASICYRVNDGTAREKRAKDGSTYYVYRHGADGAGIDRPGDAGRRPSPRASTTGPAPERADEGTLHAVYSALLADGRTRLCDEHRRALEARGLSPEEISRRG
jgi:hypothetical protein